MSKMPQLYLHNRAIDSIFELLGKDENDITYSIGWALSRSRSFLRQFVHETTGHSGDVRETTIRLQHYREWGGITDIEIELAGAFHIVVEAKRGWNLPSAKQVRKYAPRLRSRADGIRKIIALSECSPEYARHNLPLQQVRGIPVETVSWKKVARMATRALATGNHAEKRLLRELLSYMGRVTTVQDIDSNWVYVVSLAGRGIDNVTRKRVYFHPVGVHGWPKEPPNYVAFRYEGKLQSIHHVNRYELVDERELYKLGLIPRVPAKKRTVHFLYKLGSAIVPSKKIPTGKIYANGRVRCMLDTLFTSKTIAHARDVSNKRNKRSERES